jgi:hypothetical protein
MSASLIALNPDLKRLRDEGFDIAVVDGHLVVTVPYLNSQREIKSGKLVSTLTLAGNKTVKPDTHVVYFAGEYPHKADGNPLAEIVNQTLNESRGGLPVSFSFSSKPPDGYADYFDKMASYARILAAHAQALDPSATAQSFSPVASESEDDIFKYVDTATSRAGLGELNQKIALKKVAIIGLGGTGAYILDPLVKTPINEIHLFDGDIFFQHNAFRSPGAATLQDLEGQMPKVSYYESKYSQLRRGIVPHVMYVDETNAVELREMEFVFIAIDNGPAKLKIIYALEGFGIPFIDVGMGVDLVDGAIAAILRVTTSTPKKRDHIRQNQRISFGQTPPDPDYNRNIQIVELNMANAALAVIRFKKLFGFYHDFEHEHHSTYATSGNDVTNEDEE